MAERTHEFKLSVPADPLSLGIVRRAVQGLMDICGEEVTNRLAVIYSELVTNAIRHSGVRPNEALEVTLEIGPDGIRGTVKDSGASFDADRLPPRLPNQEGGFGLRIVDELVARWGVRSRGGAEVWFEL